MLIESRVDNFGKSLCIAAWKRGFCKM